MQKPLLLLSTLLLLSPLGVDAAVNALRNRAEARTLSFEQLDEVFREGTIEEGK